MSFLSNLNPAQGAVIGNTIQTAGNVIATKVANASNEKLFNQNLSFQREMWERENQYNTPLEQMKRLREAGLNPNLVYGDQGSTGNAESINPTSQPQMQAPQLFSGLGQSLSSAINAQNLAQAEITYKEEQTNIARKTLDELTEKINALKLSNQHQALENAVRKITSAIEASYYSSNKGRNNYTQFLDDQCLDIGRKFDLTLQQVKASAMLITAQVCNLMADTETKDALRPIQVQQGIEDIKYSRVMQKVGISESLLNESKRILTSAQTITEDYLRESRYKKLQSATLLDTANANGQNYKNSILRAQSTILGDTRTQAAIMIFDRLFTPLVGATTKIINGR